MNIQRGLERMSAVWWGFWGLLAMGALVAGLISRGADKELAALGAGGAIAAYVAHRITCWVVAGFFAPRS
jgi:hypothetical protein